VSQQTLVTNSLGDQDQVRQASRCSLFSQTACDAMGKRGRVSDSGGSSKSQKKDSGYLAQCKWAQEVLSVASTLVDAKTHPGSQVVASLSGEENATRDQMREFLKDP